MGSLRMTRLHEEEIGEASSLVAEVFREEQRCVPAFRSCFEHEMAFVPKLRKLVREVPSVGAYHGGRLVGFMTGFVIPSWRGKKTVYCPEWAHAAVEKDRREIYEAMYAKISRRWFEEKCYAHLITHFAHAEKILEAFSWLGFGMVSADAVRDLSPPRDVNSSVATRRATIGDLESVVALRRKLDQHMADAPIFLSPRDESSYFSADWLSDASRAIWVAVKDRKKVAYMAVGPANPSAALVIRDRRVASIYGAFTEKKSRGQGMGTALLNRSIEWASAKGYGWCAVDFEPQNLEGRRFWLKHFTPICYSLVRSIYP